MKPVMVATWNFGVKAVLKGMEILLSGGTLAYMKDKA